MGYKDQIRYTEDDRLLDSVNNRNTTSQQQFLNILEDSHYFNQGSGSNIDSNYGRYQDTIAYTEHSLLDKDRIVTITEEFPKTQIQQIFENSHFYVERDDLQLNKVSPDRNQGQILIPHEFYFADDNLTYQISRKQILLNGHLTGYSIDHSSTGGLQELYDALCDAGYTKSQQQFIYDLKDTLMNWHDL